MDTSNARGAVRGRHIPALDGLRGVAVLMVFVFHFCQAYPDGGWFAATVGRVAPLGQSGVDLFFVLSGFLITGILIDARGSDRPLVTFYARRAVRIFPLYYAALGLFCVVVPLIGLRSRADLGAVWWYLAYAQNVPPTFGWNLPGPGHFWSLAVEEHFYLLWPFLVLRSSSRRVAVAAAGMIGLAVACRVGFVALGLSTFYFTGCRLDGLAVGGLLAVAARAPGGLGRLRQWGPWVVGASVAIGGVLYPAFSGAGTGWVQVVKPLLYAALYGGVLATLVGGSAGGWPTRVACWPAFRATGKYSYAMYVFHPPILFLAAGPVGHLAPTGAAATLAFAATLAASYGVAVLSWELFERRFLALKDRFPLAPGRTAPVALPRVVHPVRAPAPSSS